MKYITIFGSSRISSDSDYYKKSYEIATALSRAGYGIITGGGGGIMEAANKGAFEAKGESIGINVILPNEQRLNSYCTRSLTLASLSERKNALIKDSFAFIILPGGFGTLDEVFEVMTLAQTMIKRHKVIFVGSQFWSPLFDFFKQLLDGGLIEANSDFYKLLDNIDDILKFLDTM